MKKKKKIIKKIPTSAFNTNIRTDVLNSYRDTCKDIGISMRFPVESFMEQFANGNFKLRIGHGALRSMPVDVELKDNIDTEE